MNKMFPFVFEKEKIQLAMLSLGSGTEYLRWLGSSVHYHLCIVLIFKLYDAFS